MVGTIVVLCSIQVPRCILLLPEVQLHKSRKTLCINFLSPTPVNDSHAESSYGQQSKPLHFRSLTLSYVVCKRTLYIHDNNIGSMSSKLVHTTYVCTLLPSCILIIQYIMHLTKSIVTLPDTLIAIYKRSEQSVEFLNLC